MFSVVVGAIAAAITIAGTAYGLIRSEVMYAESTKLAKDQFSESQRLAEEQFRKSMAISDMQYKQSLKDANMQNIAFTEETKKQNEREYKAKFGSLDR